MTRFMPILAVALAGATAAHAAPGDHFIVNWDLDGDGAVTLAEIETRRGDVFFTFDADENGLIDADEYVMFDEARANDMANEPGHGQGGGMGRVAEGMTLEFNDINGNGDVTEAEFITQSAAWLALIDRDGSGTVTSADFGRP